jgi:predicted TIM-barrel fold metal-dependent hydrolase
MPGGLGAIIRHAHPAAIDRLAADFPNLRIVAAHPGWPWTDEMIAVALHKGNVSWELSGWAPKYFSDALKRDIKGRLQDKIMFGSDYPSIPYERLFREWRELGYSDELMEKIFHKNAERILGL